MLPKGVPQGQTESGGIVLAAICWAPSAQRRCHPEEALYLPTFSHLLIVNKVFSLSLSLSLSLIPWGEMVFRMFDVAPPLLQPTFNPCLVPKKLPSIEFIPIKKEPTCQVVERRTTAYQWISSSKPALHDCAQRPPRSVILLTTHLLLLGSRNLERADR